MNKNDINEIFFNLFKINIEDEQYSDFDFEKKFLKKILKLKGKEIYNILYKIIEILSSENLSRYKNLKYNLKKYKRVHVNTSYVILFYDDKNKKVFFIDYNHHDKIYR